MIKASSFQKQKPQSMDEAVVKGADRAKGGGSRTEDVQSMREGPGFHCARMHAHIGETKNIYKNLDYPGCFRRDTN